MHKILTKLLIVVMVLALGAASAFANVWDAKSSDVAVRADHNPGDEGYTPEQQDEFTNQVGPEMNAANGEGSTATLLDTEGDRPANTAGYLTQFFGMKVTHTGAEAKVVMLKSPTFEANLEGYTPANLGVYKIKEGAVIATLPNYGNTAADGYWVLVDSEGNVLASDAALTNGSYQLQWWVLDNGAYDLDATLGIVVDPVSLAPVGGDDDSDSGCVLNPAATMSLEWLLVLLAPALLVFRRKK